MADPIRVLSLFSGDAGLDLAVHRGARAVGREAVTVGYVERELFAVASVVAAMERGALAPAPVFAGDVCEFDGRDLLGAVDLVAGGFPCNDLSKASRTQSKRLAGEHSGLWREFARLIREVRPGYVFMENTTDLLGGGLDQILGDLAECGLDAEWDVWSAVECGANHLRRRLFMLAADPRHVGYGLAKDEVRPGRVRAELRSRWADEPDVPRVDDGPSSWVDRRRLLGGMVAPAQGAAAFAELWHRVHGVVR